MKYLAATINSLAFASVKAQIEMPKNANLNPNPMLNGNSLLQGLDMSNPLVMSALLGDGSSSDLINLLMMNNRMAVL